MGGTENNLPAPKRRSKKRWILWLAVGVAGGAALYLREPRIYEASTTVLIIPQRVPERIVQSTVTVSINERLDMILQQILSRTRLERIIQEFGLYELERRQMIMEEVIERMRRDISVSITRPVATDQKVQSFSVSFKSAAPRTAMRVTERLGALFVQENLEDRQLLLDQTDQFLKGQIDEMRGKLLTSDVRVLDARRRGHSFSALTAEHEVLVETFKRLVAHGEASKLAVALERRQIGEQFKIMDGASLPERPLSPRLFPHLALGSLAGLSAGIVFSIGASLLRRARTPATRAAAAG